MDETANDSADHLFRRLFEGWRNFRSIVKRVAPDLANRCQFEKMEVLRRGFFQPHLTERECDILVKVPYEVSESREVLVCVLLEAQSKPSRYLVLRVLFYMVFYWERQFREWETLEVKGRKPPLKLTPILPIVLSSKRWGKTPREVIELLDQPSEFHAFAPNVKPIFWEIAGEKAEALLTDQDPVINVLALVQSENANIEELKPIYERILRQLDKMPSEELSHWKELFRFLLDWLYHRRPKSEREDWMRTTQECEELLYWQPEKQAMKQSIADSYREEGFKIGEQVGEKRGRLEGKIESLRATVLRIGSKRLGPPPADVKDRIEQIADLADLESMVDRILDLPGWNAL